jgi:mannose-6-phosphate isomerase class I
VSQHSNYEKFPTVPAGPASDCVAGWEAIAARLSLHSARTICIECYPGVLVEEIERQLSQRLVLNLVLRTADFFRPVAEIERMLAPHLTDDPVFGRMNGIEVRDFFEPAKLQLARHALAGASGRVLIVGTGATLLAPDADVLVYADMARWEIQMRQRRGEISNLGAENRNEHPSLKYKRAFFVDWRAADRLKKCAFPRSDYILDTNDRSQPKLATGNSVRIALAATARQPFRVVPFFDPGPWGGQWMRKVCGLPADKPNYAWCFDCVPEENSLLLRFGSINFELPSINLVFFQPRELLGEAVHARFGTEFPIRFDFLDTMEGGNLSLQVHPLTEYMADRFGMHYTQDESYYILDAAADASVYLGLHADIEPQCMAEALEAAQTGGPPFRAERFVNRWPAKKHDHFLIPAGTVHCSGRNSLVLEISATPYIFTFKLWDWERMGLDGRPRPIHLGHGLRNMRWDRTTDWVSRHLINRIEPIGQGSGWREERTGLHEREFIETRRHWFHGPVPHDTQGGVNVLNLVEGRAAVVESPDGAFPSLEIHYAETFIVPAATGPYTIRPLRGECCATIKAFVRTRA